VIAALAAAAALALPASGVAVESHGAVRLLGLDGHVVRTLPGWRIAPAFGTPVGPVYLRDRARRVWRLEHGALSRIVRVPRPRFSEGCFSTARRTRICGYPYGDGPSRVLVGGRVVPGSKRKYGHWLAVDVSARGRLLAQWSGICEIPTAYVGDVHRIRAAIYPTIESFALGWAGDRPVYAFPTGGCGEWFDHPGVYVAQTRIAPMHRGDVAELWR
jgi:hypothetical protein